MDVLDGANFVCVDSFQEPVTSEEQGNEVINEPGKSQFERVPQSRTREKPHLIRHRDDQVYLVGAGGACDDVFGVYQ
jgi:hypothetical protein